jgi:hypothetical protein
MVLNIFGSNPLSRSRETGKERQMQDMRPQSANRGPGRLRGFFVP